MMFNESSMGFGMGVPPIRSEVEDCRRGGTAWKEAIIADMSP